MRISWGPAPLNWGKEKLIEFYNYAAQSMAEEVYLGEVTCPERGKRFKHTLLDIAYKIKEKGKRLYISSYALVTRVEDIYDIKDLLSVADGLEINNLAFLDIGFQGDLIAGLFLNIYNSYTANYLCNIGFKRVVLPAELGEESIEKIEKEAGLEVEILARGRIPLAISRRCYTMRAMNEDKCQMFCMKYPDGLLLETLTGERLFRINGREILSDKIHATIDKWRNNGVSVFRMEPRYDFN